jgi:hypothetical protein
VALLGSAFAARAQEIEPRAYSNAPIGVNFVVTGIVRTDGDLADTLPITDANLRTTSLVAAYARVIDFGGKSGKFDVIVPYTRIEGDAIYQGDRLEGTITGFGRPVFRVSVNLYGAPSLSLREFRGWKQDVIVGASIAVAPPWGQYDETRLVNVSSNRWTVKPEIGVSKAIGRWTIEGQLGVIFFTDNDEFYNGHRREQDPIASLQGHVIHAFESGQWISVDATYFAGGRTTVDGALRNDLQQNWRFGLTYAVPLGRLDSIKVALSSGVEARTGNNFDLLGVFWQHRWGGGLE